MRLSLYPGRAVTFSKLTLKAGSRLSPNKGRGLFVLAPIKKGEWIAEWAGEIFNERQLAELPSDRRSNCVQIATDGFLVPIELTDGDFINHSCQPNAGIQGDRTLIALRDLEPGEEITYDYAMTDTSPYDEFECLCGSYECRGRVTGVDWQLPEMRKRYQGYFSSYVEKLISNEAEQSCCTDAKHCKK